MTSQDDDWLRVRGHLQRNRYELGLAAGRELYPGTSRVAGTPLLTDPQWIPATPVALDSVVLERSDDGPVFGIPEPRYSDTMARLARPAVFENRPTYRLLDAILDGDHPRMRFGDGHYFDGVDTGEAVAHEIAAAHLARTNGTVEQSHRSKVPFVPDGGLPGRAAIGDPVDPSRRPVNVAISAVTIRLGDTPSFLVHHRDPQRVAHAGGLFQVLPVGIFQPVSPDTAEHDFDLWRCLQREFVEEVLGEPEASGRVEYEYWEGMRPFVLGMGVDPLTLATDLLVAVVVDAPAHDRMFAGRVAENDEGTVSEHPFTADVVDRFVNRERMQAAGAAVVALAWQYRDQLLS